MDYSQIYCAIVISFIFVVLFLKTFPTKKPKILEVRRNLTKQNENRPEIEQFHDFGELRHMSLLQLEKYNVVHGKMTDRYWREIFRRQNDTYHPDHINVSRLQTANILTALDECLPQGSMHEFTITGLVPKPHSARKCEVMRYLRERVCNQNYELRTLSITFNEEHVIERIDDFGSKEPFDSDTFDEFEKEKKIQEWHQQDLLVQK